MTQFLWYLINFYLLILSCSVIKCQENIGKLPHCEDNKKTSGLVIVSTLDGQISALNWDGELFWQMETGPGPLLTSNIHRLELTNNGQWIRIIPSLSGSLYKFDGTTIGAIPITADSLLTSSFRYSDDLVISGGKEVRKYGIALNSGKSIYECSLAGCSNQSEADELDDIIVIERNTQTVYAAELRTGSERWNFSVGQHNIKIPHVSCVMDSKPVNLNVTAVLPEGLIIAKIVNIDVWKYKFDSPIVRVWKWDGRDLDEVDLFSAPGPLQEGSAISPAIYVGMHNKQLYVHESVTMLNTLRVKHGSDVVITESKSVAQIPWKPIVVTSVAVRPVDDSDGSTALSVLYGSEYVNGNGYYLYHSKDIEKQNTVLCANNITIKNARTKASVIITSIWDWWKEILLIVLTTSVIVLCNRHFVFGHYRKTQEVIFVERGSSESMPMDKTSQLSGRTHSESSDSSFPSRYVSDFEPISCLGKGGFGVVFHVKKKFDECNYAIKRILLPDEPEARERVMREVKALAKLDHRNIVRYYNAWLEYPPHDWHVQHDQQWLCDFSTNVSTTTHGNEESLHKRSRSIAIDMEIDKALKFSSDNSYSRSKVSDSDSYIVFQSDTQSASGSPATTASNVTVNNSTLSEHLRKKINWRRPDRRTHSLDITSKGSVAVPEITPVFLYIQMQLCRKESLKDWLSINKNREFSYVLHLFEQIVEAVEYVHLQGLIHRDLKPSNIFFSLEGQIKIGDFGLATRMHENVETGERWTSLKNKNYTKAVGTHLYMSPEQFAGQRYSYKVDIFSLGIIFFELLVPFSTEMERVSVLTNLRKYTYPPEFTKKYHKEFVLLNIMLSEDPEQRPTTIGIRARPPFEREDAMKKLSHHFELPSKLDTVETAVKV